VKGSLAAEVHVHKNNNVVTCDWSTLESSWLVSARKGSGGVKSPCLTFGMIREGSHICFWRDAKHMKPKVLYIDMH